jgi:hypothetical protein
VMGIKWVVEAFRLKLHVRGLTLRLLGCRGESLPWDGDCGALWVVAEVDSEPFVRVVRGDSSEICSRSEQEAEPAEGEGGWRSPGAESAAAAGPETFSEEME